MGLKTKILKSATAALLVAGFIVACGGDSGKKNGKKGKWTSEDKAFFMDGCTDGIVSLSASEENKNVYCECMLENVSSRYSPQNVDQFLSDDDFQEVVNSCEAKSFGSNPQIDSEEEEASEPPLNVEEENSESSTSWSEFELYDIKSACHDRIIESNTDLSFSIIETYCDCTTDKLTSAYDKSEIQNVDLSTVENKEMIMQCSEVSGLSAALKEKEESERRRNGIQILDHELNSDKTFVYEFEDSKYVGSLKIRDLNEDYITGSEENISIEFSEKSSSDCKFTYENFSSSLVHIRLDAVEPLLGSLDEFVCEAKVTVTRLDTNESAKTAVSVLVKK